MNHSLRPTISVEQLHVFSAVARHGHVTRAARAIRLSQGAVSQQVQRLEAALGVVLIERAGRGIRLTDAGRAVAEAAGAALAAVHAVEQTAEAFRGLHRGRLAIAASNTVGIHRAPGWIATFLDRHPHVDVQLRMANTTEAINDLAGGVVDLALVEGDVPAGAGEVMALEDDELVLVAATGHPLAAVPVVRAAELAHHRYLAREDGSGTEALARRLLGTAYRKGPVLELGHLEAVHAAVVAGLGYGVLPLIGVADDVTAGRVVVIGGPRRRLARTFRAVRRTGHRAPALDAFWAMLGERES